MLADCVPAQWFWTALPNSTELIQQLLPRLLWHDICASCLSYFRHYWLKHFVQRNEDRFYFQDNYFIWQDNYHKPPPKGCCLGQCLLQGILTHMMVFVSLLHLYVPQALDIKASLHHSRRQPRLFVPCCQPGSTFSSCLHLDTHRNLWAHLIGVPGHLSFLISPFLNLPGSVLAPKPGKAPLPGLFSSAMLTTHVSISVHTEDDPPPAPVASVKLSPSHGSPHSSLWSPTCYAQHLETITHHRCSRYLASRQMIDKSVCEGWKLLKCVLGGWVWCAVRNSRDFEVSQVLI